MRPTHCASFAVLVVCSASCTCSKHEEGTVASASRSRAVEIASAVAVVSHEGQRPPKPTPLASVTPPNLPKLKAQAANVPPPPRKPSKDEGPCGSVWTGEEDVPLECDTPPSDGHLGSPAVALIPYELLHAPKGDLPPTVDHRLDGFEGRTLSQGKAGTCTAFSLASQIDHAIGLWTGKPGDVSVMQLWAHYHVGHDSVRPNFGHPLAGEADWPYDAARAKAWAKCKQNDPSCLTDDERHKLDELEKKGTFVLEEVEHLPQDETRFDVMQAKLAAGRDIGVGGKLPKGFKPVGDPGSKYIAEFAEVREGKGAHAFSITGYTHVDGERYFLIKNSWGPKWGDNGYAWIHEQSLGKISHGGSVLVVDPVDAGGLRRHRRKRGAVAACAAGEAPDSVDGACKPLCGDGGPRHGGYCGTTEDCTRGFVNVTGYCVLAAPATRGTEPTSGIAFACAPSGCVYTIPKGTGGCTSASCQKSCPAPDFRLGRGKGGLLCLE